VSRILGRREFWALPLTIDYSVLDPRPETETVVELALDWITTRHLRNEKLRVLDIGTGSGALLLALLSELKAASGVATDKSVAALSLARANARRLGFADRCTFIACDFAAALRGPFDLIVSNPPYVSSGDIAELPPEVRDYDPRLALDGGEDGLDAYRAITTDALRLLVPRGRLIVELGHGQANVVNAIATAAGLSVERPPRADLAGISRALCATAP
jgi:release factor glutamine methyltransferase